MTLLASSDPAVASVAPFGGTRAVFTPDPLAQGVALHPAILPALQPWASRLGVTLPPEGSGRS